MTKKKEDDINDFIAALITMGATVSKEKEEGNIKAEFKKPRYCWITPANEVRDNIGNMINPQGYSYKISSWMDDYIDGFQVNFSPLSS